MENEIIYINNEKPEITFANKNLRTATEKIFKIGSTVRKCAYETAYIIANVDSTKCYEEDGFKNVHEWVMKTFGFKKSASYTLLKIGKEYTRALIDENGKVKGFASNLTGETEIPDVRDFTTTQIEKLLPAGHDVAVDLVETGEVTPEMTCKEIEKVVKNALNPETETEETEISAEPEEPEEIAPEDVTIIVHDEDGNEYEVPLYIINQYRKERN